MGGCRFQLLLDIVFCLKDQRGLQLVHPDSISKLNGTKNSFEARWITGELAIQTLKHGGWNKMLQALDQSEMCRTEALLPKFLNLRKVLTSTQGLFWWVACFQSSQLHLQSPSYEQKLKVVQNFFISCSGDSLIQFAFNKCMTTKRTTRFPWQLSSSHLDWSIWQMLHHSLMLHPVVLCGLVDPKKCEFLQRVSVPH